MKVTKEDLWNCLEAALREKNCAIEGELDDLKEGLFEDYKIALKHLGAISATDFIDFFVDELFNFPLHMSDNMIVPNATQ